MEETYFYLLLAADFSFDRFNLYSLGDIPVYNLKYFLKVNCSGKFNSCATSLIEIFCLRSSFFDWFIIIIEIHSDGVLFDTFFIILVKWLAEKFKLSA